MRIALILIFFLYTSCGYEPLYVNKNNNKFKFQEVKLEGNTNLSKKIRSRLSLEELTSDKNLNKLIIKSSSKKIEASKNSKGRVTSYRIYIDIDLIISNTNNKTVRSKLFSKDFLYNVDDDNLKTSEYQRNIENDLVNQIIREIIVYLNL